MSTVISLSAEGIGGSVADAFFERIEQLEAMLSRFRSRSDVSRLARGELGLDDVDPCVRVVLARCEELRRISEGAFDHEPRRRSGDPGQPVLDPNAVAKGWIIEEAALVLRMAGGEFLVNAGGDITTGARADAMPWRVAVQHPDRADAVLGTFELTSGAVATSGTYERGAHLRGVEGNPLVSVSVVGPDLALADGLATAVFATGESPPLWWAEVDPRYGLLTLSSANRLRWLPPRAGSDARWIFPLESSIER